MATNIDIHLLDELRLHTEEYGVHAKASFLQLADVWQDLETPEEQQKEDLDHVIQAAQQCWNAAVSNARDQQQKVRDSIQLMLAEMRDTKEALGAEDPAAEAELVRLQGNRCAHKTLRAWEQDVQTKARYWQKQKLQRVSEYEDLQARISVLRRLCGLGPLPAADKPDISKANMEFLKLELERLTAEKERREDLLRRLLDELHGVCGDIGEDVKAAAAEVHPNLVYIWDGEAAKVLRDMYKLTSSYTSGSSGGMIDLSDAAISALSSKLLTMKDLKAARAAHAAEVLGVLHSLWDATDVPPEERAHFVKMMSGSLRLHARSLEKCMAEVRRLEDVRTQQMVDLVNTKCAELRALCADSHVEEPQGLSAALAAINCPSEQRNPGAAAELLAKLLHMLAEVQVLAAKRSALIGSIKEVEAAVQEDDWLTAYDADEQRYKGRDANKKLQRAIKAKKLREALPGLIGGVRGLLAEWRDTEGAAFMYDGQDYEFEVLEVLAAEVEEAAQQRAAKAARTASSRRQSGITSSSAAAACLTPPGRPTTPRAGAGVGGSRGMPPRPGSACGQGTGPGSSPGVRRADGPATPIPLRGVSSRTLSERHSICVVRSGRESMAGPAGPAALSRSGEVRLPSKTPTATSSSSKAVKPSTHAAGPAARRAGTTSATASPAAAAGMTTPPTKQKTAAGALSDTCPADGTAAAAANRDVRGAAAAGAGAKRGSTSTKLDNIFRRSSVQHPVAKLATPDKSTISLRTPGSDGKRGRAARPVPGSGGDQALEADDGDRDV